MYVKSLCKLRQFVSVQYIICLQAPENYFAEAQIPTVTKMVRKSMGKGQNHSQEEESKLGMVVHAGLIQHSGG
jgi:hypothetical protein